ncbi:MAG: 30S ribosomal protein S3 [Candidatus Woesearchaeota archaeon]|nr:MAG: 30S ribosomal protein S3 [Candidatus Woesearchaeota archaeon]
MIEREFIKQKLREYKVHEYILSQLAKAGTNKTEIQRTPLGEKIIIYTSRPGLVVGRKGENIKNLTKVLKTKFNLENPQIEIGEVKEPLFDAQAVADNIASGLEKFGPKRFKSLGYGKLQEVIDAGALGAEIVIGGRGVPGARAKSWRFAAGHMKKSGDIAQYYVKKAKSVANLKSGTIGIQVLIMTPDIILPDHILFKEVDKKPIVGQIANKPEVKEDKKTGEKEKKPQKKLTKPRAPRKKAKEIKENGNNKENRTEKNG